MKCFVCGNDAVKIHHRTNMCEKHGRFLQMQKTAKMDKKYVPSIYELEKLVPQDMSCPDCGVKMNWRDHANRKAGAVLQHYRDGNVAITCLSCNTKHGLMPGDDYRDLPDGHKYCSMCKTTKPISEFWRRGKGDGNYPKSHCKECCLEQNRKWRASNPEKYKQLVKKHNLKKKEKHVTPAV